LLWFTVAANATGQEQERKLVDRLLKPDTSLANSEQSKSFSQAGSAKTQPRVSGGSTFYVAEKNLTKNFVVDRRFAPNSYLARNFVTREATLPATRPSRTFSTRSVAYSSWKASASNSFSTPEFAGKRPFYARGKSQKALDSQHHSLTIEEVRELLNKNK
jgi:hypothetical protein